jgi:hypothetical protein
MKFNTIAGAVSPGKISSKSSAICCPAWKPSGSCRQWTPTADFHYPTPIHRSVFAIFLTVLLTKNIVRGKQALVRVSLYV